jgi:hypothetical protein
MVAIVRNHYLAVHGEDIEDFMLPAVTVILRYVN